MLAKRLELAFSSYNLCAMNSGICVPCRHRKRRCDGRRPICGPCVGSSRPNCVYDDDTEQHVLEAKISAMEDRLQSLQRPSSSSPSSRRSASTTPTAPPPAGRRIEDITVDVRRRL
ncbi:hypothetical protein PM082_007342 [Marasmius tenuissimus]|nr:hypothetical protein PM082_007342 [Marasmius tenuissimus]